MHQLKNLHIQSWFLRTALCFRSTECQKTSSNEIAILHCTTK